MRIRLIGDARDVTGFGLAGIDGAECRTRAEVEAALDGCARDGSAAIVLVSAEAAALAPDPIDRFRRAVDGPIVVVLPLVRCGGREQGRAA